MKFVSKTVKTHTLMGWCLLVSLTATAEDVVQESLNWKTLRIQPSVSMSAPLAHEQDIILPTNLNIEARYDLNTLLDVHGGLHTGAFKGVSLGGTYHLKDAEVTKSTRFIVAETGRKVYFYRNNSSYRSIFGPTANLQLGSYSKTGFYGRLDAGIDLQTQSRAYYQGYSSARNGATSLKLLATLASFKQYEESANSGLKSRIGAGAIISYSYERRPWKRLTLFANGEFGYMTIFGVQDYNTGYVTLSNTKSNVLLQLKLGASVGI